MKVSIKPLAIVIAVAILIKNIKLDLEAKSCSADVEYVDAKGNVAGTTRAIVAGAEYDAWRAGDDSLFKAAVLKQLGAVDVNTLVIAEAPTEAPAEVPAPEAPAAPTKKPSSKKK